LDVIKTVAVIKCLGSD